MEFTKVEVSILEKAEVDAVEQSVVALESLQLALVGGGVGEVLFG